MIELFQLRRWLGYILHVMIISCEIQVDAGLACSTVLFVKMTDKKEAIERAIILSATEANATDIQLSTDK